MKKLFTLVCGILLAVQFAMAEMPAVKIVRSDGSIQFIGLSEGDYMEFTGAYANIVTFSFQSDSPSVGEDQITDGCTVVYADGLSDIANLEIGVCYSITSKTPTYADQRKALTNAAGAKELVLDGLTEGTAYYYRMYAKLNDNLILYSDVRSAMTTTDAHESVDLGLPSGNLWATVNLDATTEADTGNWYWFGNTNYSESWNGNKVYGDDGEAVYEDGTVLKDSDDPVTQLWGTKWHTPSLADFQELLYYCTCTESTRENSDGETIEGVEVCNKNDSSKKIFLPLCGKMQSSDTYDAGSYGYYMINVATGSESDAYVAKFSNYFSDLTKDSVYYGRGTTRAVKKK